MKRLIPAVLFAVAFGAAAHAQDNTVTRKTQVDADDARAVVMKGCLIQAPGSDTFILTGATGASGEDLTVKSRVETDVDKGDVEVKGRTSAEVDRDGDRPVGTSGTSGTFEVTPRAGVDLAAHVGKQVEISAVMVEAGKGDADIEIRERGKVETENRPDASIDTKTEAEIPRGTSDRLTALSVTSTGAACN
jgi:hypothetical protein